MTDTQAKIETLSARWEFNGIDIQRRSRGTQWPKPWRVRTVTNTDHWRFTAYGDTMQEAVENLMQMVDTQDKDFYEVIMNL